MERNIEGFYEWWTTKVFGRHITNEEFAFILDKFEKE
jgi:hypothetical protein